MNEDEARIQVLLRAAWPDLGDRENWLDTANHNLGYRTPRWEMKYGSRKAVVRELGGVVRHERR